MAYDSGISLRFAPDPDHEPYQQAASATWPLFPGQPYRVLWSVTSEAEGFRGLLLTGRCSDPTLLRPRLIRATLHRLHHGRVTKCLQDVKLELPAGWDGPPQEQVRCWIEDGVGRFQLSCEGFDVPPSRPGTGTDHLIQIILCAEGPPEGRFGLQAELACGGGRLPLPAYAFEARPPAWIPLVSGSNPDAPLSPPGPASRPSDERPRNASTPGIQLLNQPALRCATAIFERRERSALEAAVEAFWAWMEALPTGFEASLELRWEKPLGSPRTHRLRLEEVPTHPQVLEWASRPGGWHAFTALWIPRGEVLPAAGFSIHRSYPDEGLGRRYVLSALCQLDGVPCLSRTRDLAPKTTDTLHVSAWGVEGAWTGYPSKEIEGLLEPLMGRLPLLQGWCGPMAWVPAFDVAQAYRRTPYEESSFIASWGSRHLSALLMSAEWCGRKVRMVAPTLWLGPALAGRVSERSLAEVADLRRLGPVLRLDRKAGVPMEALERALLPLLPVERGRLPESLRDSVEPLPPAWESPSGPSTRWSDGFLRGLGLREGLDACTPMEQEVGSGSRIRLEHFWLEHTAEEPWEQVVSGTFEGPVGPERGLVFNLKYPWGELDNQGFLASLDATGLHLKRWGRREEAWLGVQTAPALNLTLSNHLAAVFRRGSFEGARCQVLLNGQVLIEATDEELALPHPQVPRVPPEPREITRDGALIASVGAGTRGELRDCGFYAGLWLPAGDPAQAFVLTLRSPARAFATSLG